MQQCQVGWNICLSLFVKLINKLVKLVICQPGFNLAAIKMKIMFGLKHLQNKLIVKQKSKNKKVYKTIIEGYLSNYFK